MAGPMINDVRQAVSYLARRPEVDPSRIAAGCSMGSFRRPKVQRRRQTISLTFRAATVMERSGSGALNPAFWELTPRQFFGVCSFPCRAWSRLEGGESSRTNVDAVLGTVGIAT